MAWLRVLTEGADACQDLLLLTVATVMESFVSATEAMKIFGQMPEVVQAWLMTRAGAYDIPPHELLMKAPASLLDNPLEIFHFIDAKHISHIVATSKGGSPNSFTNWIFEDAHSNIVRHNDPMGFGEYLRAQADNLLDGSLVEFGTADPGSHGYDKAFSQAFGVDAQSHVDMTGVSDGLFDATKNTWHVGHDGVRHVSEGAMSLSDSLLETLEDIGIPVTYVTVRGVSTALPFLKSIDWKRFQSDSKYRLQQIARALRVFRDGGWKEAAKSIVMGFMISAFPPISYLVSAVGLTGVAAMGTRWLATKVSAISGPLGAALEKIADTLDKAHAFLRRALNSLEKVVNVVIESSSTAVKQVVKAGVAFADAVYKVTSQFAADIARSTKSAVNSVKKLAQGIGSRVSGWIFSWFCQPATTA